MSRSAFALILAALVAWGLAAPAGATTAIAYSENDNYYGWCAGFSESRSVRCARGYCADAGGDDCRIVLECPDSFGAIALAGSPAAGLGAVCDLGDIADARMAALAACVVATRTLCWTDAAFNRSGRAASKSDNIAFDRAWYAQALMKMIGYDIADFAVPLRKPAVEALRDFQKTIGRTPTGKVDAEIVDRLLDAARGAQRLGRSLKKNLLDANSDISDVTFASALRAVPERTFAEELEQGPDDRRLLALATILSARGHACSLPARGARLVSEESGWQVECAEGRFQLILSDDGDTVVVVTR